MAARRISPAVYAVMVVVAAVATAAMLDSAQGQQDLPGCVADLNGCLAYLNSSSNVPDPETCCNALKGVASSPRDLNCLCALVNGTQLFRQLRIDSTRVVGLPDKCGAGFSLSGCIAEHSPSAPPPADAAPPPDGQAPASSPLGMRSPPSNPSPPEPSRGSPPESGQSPTATPTAGNAWTGLPSLMPCFLSCALFWLTA